MSASNGVNVLRYSALFVGVFYGFFHQSTLTTQSRVAKMDREYERRENLIAQAKAAWSQKSLSTEKKTAGGDIITDPNDSRFDLEAYLTVAMADEAKED